MKALFNSGLAMATMLSAQAVTAQATSAPKERIGSAFVEFSDGCPKSDAYQEPRFFDPEGGQIVVTGSSIFFPILGEFFGNVVSGGLNAIGAALEDAARATAVGGEGRINFEYYTGSDRTGALIPMLGGEDMSCLLVKIPKAISPIDSKVMLSKLPTDYIFDDSLVISRRDKEELSETDVKFLSAFLDQEAETALYIEAEILSLRDGVVLNPVHIEYKTALPKLPVSKRLAAELHVSLTGPSKVENGSSSETIFGVARIKLPRLLPGDVWHRDQISAKSNVLPHRPVDGSALALSTGMVPITVTNSARDDLRSQRLKLLSALGLMRVDDSLECGQFETGCRAYVKSNPIEDSLAEDEPEFLRKFIDWSLAANSPFDEARRKEITGAVAGIREKQLAFDIAAHSSQSLLTGRLATESEEEDEKDTEVTVGSTSLVARMVLLTDENKFLKVLGSALKSADETAKTTVTTALKDEFASKPQWTANRSAYSVAVAQVAEQEVALAKAENDGDSATVAAARTELIKRKGTANEKAADIGIAIPYPGI